MIRSSWYITIYMWWPCQSRNKTNLRARHGTRANFPCATEPLLIKQRWRVPRNRTCYKKKHHGRSWTRGPPLSPRPAPLHLAAAYHLSRASPLISSHLISSHLLVGQPVIMREKKYISNFFSINKWKFHGVQVRPLIRFNLFSQFGSRSSQESSLCSMTCITEYYY